MLLLSHSAASNSLVTPMGCSPPGSSVHGILQARIIEWLPFPSPGDLLDPGIKLVSPALADRFFTMEPPEESIMLDKNE